MTLPHSQLAALRHGRSKELDNADARNKLEAGTAAESASATSTADTSSASPATGATSDARFPGISATLLNAVETADHLVVRRVLKTLGQNKAEEILAMRGEDDMTLLHLAVMLPPSGKVSVAAVLLISFRAEINAQTAWGETPLMFAARAALDCQPSGPSDEGNRLKTVQMLLEKRAEPDRTDPSGETILFEAAAYGDAEVCQALLQARAEAARRSRDGVTALDVAHSSPEILRLLRAADKALEGVEPRPLHEEYLTASEEPTSPPAAPPPQTEAISQPAVAPTTPPEPATDTGQDTPVEASAQPQFHEATREPPFTPATSPEPTTDTCQEVPAEASGGLGDQEARASAPLASEELRDIDARTSRSSAGESAFAAPTHAAGPGSVAASPPSTPRACGSWPVEAEKDEATLQREAEEEARRARMEEVASHPLVVIISVRLLPSNHLLAVSVVAGSDVGAVRRAVLEQLALASDLSIIMCEDEREDSFLLDECRLGLAQEVCARLNGDTTGTLFWAPEDPSEEAEEPVKEEEEPERPPKEDEVEVPPTKEEVEPPKKKEEPVKVTKEEAATKARAEPEEEKGDEKVAPEKNPAAAAASAAASPLKERCVEAGFTDLDWCAHEKVFQSLLDLNATWESASVKTLRQLCGASGIPLGGVLEKAEMRSRLRQVAIWREMTDFSVEAEAHKYGIEVIVQFQSRDEIVKLMIQAAYGELQPPSGPAPAAKASASGRRQSAKPKAATAAAHSAASSERQRPQAQPSRTEAKAPATKATPSRSSASRGEQQTPPAAAPAAPPSGSSPSASSSSQKPAASAHSGGPPPWAPQQGPPPPGPPPWAQQQGPPPPGYGAPPPPGQQWFGGYTGFPSSFAHNPQWAPPPPPPHGFNGSSTPGYSAASREPPGAAGASPKAEAKQPPGTSTHSQPKANARSAGSAQEQPSATQPKARAAGKPKAKGKAKSKAKSALSSSSDDDVRGGIGKQRKSELGPRVRKALKEFPGYSGDLPPMPEAEQLWTKQELYNFFYTGGFIKPNYKKAAAAPKVPRGLLAEYYNRLGLKRGDKAEVVRRAYRQLALKFHPDKNRDNPDAASKFQEIAAAYETICQVLDGKLEVAG